MRNDKTIKCKGPLGESYELYLRLKTKFIKSKLYKELQVFSTVKNINRNNVLSYKDRRFCN